MIVNNKTKFQKLYINLTSLFILNKEKRKQYRKNLNNKYFIKNNYGNLVKIFEIFLNNDDLQKIEKIFRNDSIGRFGDHELPSRIEEYEEDKANLLKGLDTEARENCLKILNRFDKSFIKGVTEKDIFTTREFIEMTFAKTYLKNNVKKVDNYYQLENYKLPVNFFEASVFYYKHGIDKLKTFNRIGDKAIIDVGCCVADSCLIFRDYTKNKIYTFEPVLENYKLAQKTIELNNLKDIVLENLALGNKEEENEIFVDKYNIGGSTILYRGYNKDFEKEKFKTTTLDKYVKENKIKVGLIKVDIEGFEPQFLEGAVETLKEQKPIILLSIYHNYHDFFKLKLFIENLNCGYKFDFFKGEDGTMSQETLLLCEVY